jgi:hypothetical protein
MNYKKPDTFKKIKTCPACGATFSCGAETGHCWCQAYELSAETFKFLKNKYADCLCEDCLRGFAQKKS